MTCNCHKLEDNGERLPAAVYETDFPGMKRLGRGKVRDVYDLDDRLLIVTTDRISAFDVVLDTPIPEKGRVLTQISLFWFDYLKDVVRNHFLTASIEGVPGVQILEPMKRHLEGRTMIVHKAKPLPVECIVRGYLVGSGWKEYQKSGTVCGIPLRPGMELAEQIDEPIFTPSTKADVGHDENISYEVMKTLIDPELAEKVRDASIALYAKAAAYARTRGIIIADTKFEFGLLDGELILIDEVLTPDSSRFWPADTYKTGANPESYDKQYVRDWLEAQENWNKEPPAPRLPADIVDGTTKRYIEAYEALTGTTYPFPAPGWSA